jgi:hypothetical protein
MRRPLLALAALLVMSPLAAAWTVRTVAVVDQGPHVRAFMDVAVGDVDGDGRPELLSTAADRWLQLHRWRDAGNDSGWRTGLIPLGDSSLVGLSLGTGDLDLDGRTEVYVGAGNLDGLSGSGRLLRLRWVQDHWERTPLIAGDFLKVVVADGDGDGSKEIYLARWSNVVQRLYPDDAGNWHGQLISTTEYSPVLDLAVGDGDRDGRPEVYFTTGANAVAQAKLRNGTWVKSVVGQGSWGSNMTGVALGDANRDGRVDVYATSSDGWLYRFAWGSNGGPAWVRERVATFERRVTYMGGSPSDVVVGDLDGFKQEAYVAAGNRVHRVFMSTDGTWIVQNLGAGSADFYEELALGAGRPGARSVFAAGRTSLVEYT